MPHLDVEDASYWLVEKSLKPNEKPIENKTDAAKGVHTPTIAAGETPITEQKPASRTFAAIVVSGKIPLENYSELFSCFIAPFSATGNKVEIEVSFKINSSESNPLTESSPQYKNAKEAAKQLGLAFSETLQ